MSDEVAAVPGGVALIEEQRKPTPGEEQDAARWLETIKRAREFDASARKQYARDRKYTRGDGRFEVTVPLAAVFTQILKSFLYARNPDVDCFPAEAVEPPPEDEVRETVRAKSEDDPELASAKQRARQQVGALGANEQQAQEALAAATETYIDEHVERLLKPHRAQAREAKSFGKTLEIIIRRLWHVAGLERRLRPAVSSGLTCGVGWIKAGWHEEWGEHPEVREQLDGVAAQMKRIGELAKLAADPLAERPEDLPDDPEGEMERLKQEVEGLKNRLNYVASRGFIVDFVAAEDIQMSPECPILADYMEAPWLAHRVFPTKEQARTQYDLGERIDGADCYYPRKPKDVREQREAGLVADVTPADADAYTRSEMHADGADTEAHVAVWEIWDRLSGMVVTTIEGMAGYACEPYAPPVKSQRFYPFFLFAPVEVDSERHPQSLVQRSASLFDEYDRARSYLPEYRRRALPKIGFDESNLAPSYVEKMVRGELGEIIGFKPIRPGTPIAQLFEQLAIPVAPPILFNTTLIRSELEEIWGISEMLAAYRPSKTATQSEIDHASTQTRLGFMRASLDDMLQQLAEYTAEAALEKMDHEDARQIAGAWAFWPEQLSGDALADLVKVRIRAGSSGAPDTARDRAAWMMALPVVRDAIRIKAQLLHSTADDVAACVQSVVEETFERAGIHTDPSQFLPRAPDQRPQASEPAAHEVLRGNEFVGAQPSAPNLPAPQIQIQQRQDEINPGVLE